MGATSYTTSSNLGTRQGAVGDRRQVCRYPVIHPDASAGWWEDKHFCTARAQMIDISMSGCLMVLARGAKRAVGQPIWLCPLELATADWIEGVVVAAHKPFLGPCSVRMTFLTPFPYESFKKLVYGTQHVDHRAGEDAPEHERDHFWK
jgi:hypothetical protein